MTAAIIAVNKDVFSPIMVTGIKKNPNIIAPQSINKFSCVCVYI